MIPSTTQHSFTLVSVKIHAEMKNGIFTVLKMHAELKNGIIRIGIFDIYIKSIRFDHFINGNYSENIHVS